MNRIMYTAQTKVVLDTLDADGVYYVKKDYIKTKYKASASTMLHAYNYLKKHMTNKPSGAEYPVWLFEDPRYGKVHQDQYMLKLSIPEDELILFDYASWEKILSMEYIPKNPADQQDYQNLLQSYNIDCGYAVFEKPYYPMIRKKIEDSWQRVFDLTDTSVLRGASWCIKKEWILD